MQNWIDELGVVISSLMCSEISFSIQKNDEVISVEIVVEFDVAPTASSGTVGDVYVGA